MTEIQSLRQAKNDLDTLLGQIDHIRRSDALSEGARVSLNHAYGHVETAKNNLEDVPLTAYSEHFVDEPTLDEFFEDRGQRGYAEYVLEEPYVIECDTWYPRNPKKNVGIITIWAALDPDLSPNPHGTYAWVVVGESPVWDEDRLTEVFRKLVDSTSIEEFCQDHPPNEQTTVGEHLSDH